MKKNKCRLVVVWASTLMLNLFFVSLSWADGNFPCILRLAKTDCWPNYQITLQPMDAETNQPLGKPVVLDKNAYETEVLIPCQPEQEISFVATTLPTVWGATPDTQYPSTHFWETPQQLPGGANRWIVSVCFAADFSSVPLPLSEKASCTCQFPPIERTQVSDSPALS
jgi:hypothetical protein